MASWRIEVGYKNHKTDSIGHGIKADIEEDLGVRGIESVSYIDAYEINAGVSEAEAREIAGKLFTDPITQEYSINAPLNDCGTWAIDVRLHDDVTDNVGITAAQGIEDILGKRLGDGESVKSIRKYIINGGISENDVKKICSRMLANEIIETYSYNRVGK